MQTQADKSSYFDRPGAARPVPALLITGIAVAVVLFSTAGIARVLGWGPNSTSGSADIPALDRALPVPAPREVRARQRCAECGAVVSMREIEGRVEDADGSSGSGPTAGNGGESGTKASRKYEITVRMADGSNQVIEDPSPANWRIGEGLLVIGGVNRSNR